MPELAESKINVNKCESNFCTKKINKIDSLFFSYISISESDKNHYFAIATKKKREIKVSFILITYNHNHNELRSQIYLCWK